MERQGEEGSATDPLPDGELVRLTEHTAIPRSRTGPSPGPPDRPVDFFVSYSLADENWATWIAAELEAAGYRVMIQSWDFVPGTHFLDFIDRGIREATAVVAVLSRSYLSSYYGRMEWLAALRAAGADAAVKLLPVRVEDFMPDGLLASITFVDLVGLRDPGEARARLRSRIEAAIAGRAKPRVHPPYPTKARTPVYPPSLPRPSGPRDAISVLHVGGPRFGRTDDTADASSVARLAALRTGLDALAAHGVPAPELLVISGDLTESGTRPQFDEALRFVVGLYTMLAVDPARVIVVPGGRDITRAACQAYFADCEADGIAPEPPYFPKWRHFTRLHQELRRNLDGTTDFDAGQPWTLSFVADLGIVVAGLNSTIAETHLSPDDEGGTLGPAQIDWFAERLTEFERDGYLRLGVVANGPGRHLTDTEPADRVIGPRLNLLVHGDPTIGAAIDILPSGLTVVGPAPGGAQLLRLTRDGMERHELAVAESASVPNGQSRFRRAWHSVAATFDAGRDTGPLTVGPMPPATAGPAADIDSETTADPTDLLLDRIAEVCEARHDRTRIRRLPGRPPSLLVTYPDGELVHQFRVAAHIGCPTAADLAAFVRVLRSTGTDTDAALVYQGPHPGTALREQAQRDGVRLRSFTEFQGLLDLRDFVAAQTERLLTDRIYPPKLYVPQRFRETVGADSSVRDDVVESMLDMLSADEGRFILLIGDFGRGKTFAMRRLASELPTRLPEAVPILIELRALDKAHTVDGLVAAHLANHGHARIDLRAFRYLLRQGRIVLLFDGFDELATRVSYDRAAEHLDTLLAAAEDCAKIVVAGRTQHFQNDAQIRTALGAQVGLLPQRRVLLLEDFSRQQVSQFLLNRYGQNEQAAHERVELIETVRDLGELARNPRMLGFIADLSAERLSTVARAGNTMSAAGLYREILRLWLSYEHSRVGDVPGAPVGLAEADLWQAVRVLALRIWESNEPLLRLDDVAEVAQALAQMADNKLSPPQATHAVGAGSLLVRTEEGMFGFIHSSVMEWLVADEIATQVNTHAQPTLLSCRPLSQLTVEFLCDLCESDALRNWLTEHADDETTTANALRISSRLRAPARADLRGALLRGEDLCYRDLSGVDLSGADLTDARLIGTRLSRAVLRDALLTNARLDKAVLRGADLTGADLSGARLARTDLRATELADSRWSRAALISVDVDEAFWAAPQTRSAVRAPGQPVLTGLLPAAVGVSFGFQTGRLPTPLAYSPDGALLAVGNEDGGVLLCDTATGQPVRTLTGHHDRIYAVAFGPPGTALVTTGADGTVRLWDPVCGEPGPVLRDHREPVWPLILDSTGQRMAFGDGTGTVRVCAPVSAEPDGEPMRIQELPGHSERVWALAFHPYRPLLAASDNAGQVRLWDLTTGRVRSQLSFQDSPMYTLTFSPDGRWLAAGGRDGRLRIWDTDTGTPVHTLDGHDGHVYAAAFHPDGQWLASGDTHGSVRLWPLAEPAGAAIPQRPLTGAIYHLTFSPDGATLAAVDSNGTLRLWDAPAGNERQDIRAHRGPVWPVAFHPNSQQVATTGKDGTLRLWDANTGQRRGDLHGHGRRIMTVHFDPTGELLATSGNDGQVRLWDPRTGRLARKLTGLADQLVSALFCPSAPLLATASNDGGVHMWHTNSWQAERELDVATDHVWASAFDPSGDVLATANDDDSVRLWWRHTGREMLNLTDHRGRVRSIAFSPDGTIVATGCDDKRVRLFNSTSGEPLATLDGHTDRVYTVRFTSDGSMLVSVSNDGTARLWRMPDGRPLNTLGGHRGRLWAGVFSPDGSLLATAGDDSAVRLWNPHTGALLHTLTGHTRRVLSVDFSPDGRLLASGADDGTTRLWDLSDADHPVTKLALLGLPEGWAAVTSDGRYKSDGMVAGEFWHVIGTCRFEPGELDSYLRDVHAVPTEEPF